MDLSTGSLGWHRTRQWLDDEINKYSEVPPNLTMEQLSYFEGVAWGKRIAYMNVRTKFNTPEESEQAEKTRREMFG